MHAHLAEGEMFTNALCRYYSVGEYLTVIMLVVGLFLFSTGDASVSPSFSILGLVNSFSSLISLMLT